MVIAIDVSKEIWFMCSSFSTIHINIVVVIVVVVIIVVIIVVVIVVVGGYIDDSVDGYEEKAEEGGDGKACFNLFLACTSV